MPSDGFELIDEIVECLPPSQWILVGGLMVHAHARLAGVPNIRTTDDADLVVELTVDDRYGMAAKALTGLGFVFQESLNEAAPAYRFVRESQRVDLMAPDRGREARYARRPVLRVPGSSSALKRTEEFETSAGSRLRIPDLAGALSLKGAAYHLPSHLPVRHLQDAVVLFACADARGTEPPSKSMKAHINALLAGLEVRPEAWSLAGPDVARRAVRGIRAHFREDWRAPDFALPRRFEAKPGRPGTP